MGKSSRDQVIGYKYYMGIHMGIGRGPVDEICEIRVGDRVAWTGSITGTSQIRINKPNLFGGTKGEGGINGYLDIMMGRSDQLASAGLVKMLGGTSPPPDDPPPNYQPSSRSVVDISARAGTVPVPGFRGVLTMFYDGLISAMNPYPKPWKFRLRRILQGWDGGPWYPERATIIMNGYNEDGELQEIHAMNPAHILYQSITDRAWGRGLSRSLMDDAWWRAAADTLYSEGFGMCIRWGRQDTLTAFAQTVLDHIYGAIYVDKLTGKFRLKLLRDDYDFDTLPVFDNDSGLLTITEASNASPNNRTNEIVVNYRNPISGEEGQVRAHNLASVQTQGCLVSNTTDYPGIPTAALAIKVAERDLRVASTNLRRFTIEVDRRGWRVQPGDVIKLRDLSRGLETVAVRVGSTEESTQTEGAIKIVAIQDVFSFTLNTFSEVQPPEWVKPDTRPSLARRVIYEMTYAETVNRVPPGEFAALNKLAGFLQTQAEKPSAVTMAYDIGIKAEGEADYKLTGTGNFTPLAQLDGRLDYLDTVLKFFQSKGLEYVELDKVLLIDNEFVKVVGIDLENSKLLIARGVWDTIPQPHGDSALIWDVIRHGGSNWKQYAGTEHIDVKIMPWTLSGGRYPIEVTPSDPLDFNFRFFRPYAPGRVTLTNLSAGTDPWFVPKNLRADYGPSEVPDHLIINWTHRDRPLQEDKAIDHMQDSIGPEQGTTYTIKVYNSNNELVRTESGLTGSQYVYTYANASEDLKVESQPLNPTQGYMTLESVRDGFESWQKYLIRFGIYKKPLQTASVSLFAMQTAQTVVESTGETTSSVTVASQAEQVVQENLEASIDGVYASQITEQTAQLTKLPPLVDLLLVEAPYITLLREGRDVTKSQLMGFAARPSDRLTDGFDFFDKTGDDTTWRDNGSQSWTPWGVLKGFMNYFTNEFEVTDTSDADGVPTGAFYPGDIILIGNELMIVQAVDGKRFTVGRGAVDTIPSVHYARAPVWFFDRAHAAANHLFGDADIAKAVVRPHTYAYPIQPDDMAVRELKMQGRPRRPYPPGMFLANGKHWFEPISALADNFDLYNPQGKDVVFTWAHRNRLTQGVDPVDHFASGIQPERGVRYKIWIGFRYRPSPREDLITVTLFNGYTEDSGWIYTAAMAKRHGEQAGTTLNAKGRVTIQFTVNAERDGLFNWQGYGMYVTVPSIKIEAGDKPGGGTDPIDPIYPPEGGGGETGGGETGGGKDPNPGEGGEPETNPGGGEGEGEKPVVPIDPEEKPPVDPPPVDPEVPPTEPPVDPPIDPPVDPTNVPGWGVDWDHGWAGELPDQRSKLNAS